MRELTKAEQAIPAGDTQHIRREFPICVDYTPESVTNSTAQVVTNSDINQIHDAQIRAK